MDMLNIVIKMMLSIYMERWILHVKNLNLHASKNKKRRIKM